MAYPFSFFDLSAVLSYFDQDFEIYSVAYPEERNMPFSWLISRVFIGIAFLLKSLKQWMKQAISIETNPYSK